jgi:hypothetical protein
VPATLLMMGFAHYEARRPNRGDYNLLLKRNHKPWLRVNIPSVGRPIVHEGSNKMTFKTHGRMMNWIVKDLEGPDEPPGLWNRRNNFTTEFQN